MNLLLYSLIIPLFGGPALGDYDSYDSLCPGQDGKTVTLPGGEYTVTCGGYYDWLVTGNRVDSGTRDSPEECVRLCSQSQDCDAMVYDSGACWEYSAQSQFLTPQVDPHGHTILLGPVLKKDPDSPDDSSDQTPITPPKTPEDYQQELDECNQEKSQLQTDKDSCVTDRDEYKADKDTCITDRDQFKKEKDLCITDRDQFKKERDQFKKERDQLKKEKDLCITDRDQFKKERDQFKQQRDVCNTDKQKVIGERDACLKKLATPPAPPPNLGPNNLFPDNYQCNSKNFGKIVTSGGRRFRIVGNRGRAGSSGGKFASWFSGQANCNIDCCIGKCTPYFAKLYSGHAHTGVNMQCLGAHVAPGGTCWIAAYDIASKPLATQAQSGACVLQPV